MSDELQKRIGNARKCLVALGEAYCGDWSDVDGRVLMSQLDDIVEMLSGALTVAPERWAKGWLCLECGCWAEYCDVDHGGGEDE